ncbi:MAG: hypothetical protein DI535_03490 [Citrobacter freundii]|nr:MAG: hypothetical protein DI535_03490 [Citrobacter freundii]
MAQVSLYDQLDKLKNQELNAARLFSASALRHPSYQRAKLKKLRSLEAEFGADKSIRKDLGFIALRAEIKVTEHLLYPNPLLRLLNRALTNVVNFFGTERLMHQERANIENAMRQQHLEKEIFSSNRPSVKEQFSATLNEALNEGKQKASSPTLGAISDEIMTPPTAPSQVEEYNSNHRQQTNSDMNNTNFTALSKDLNDLGFGKGMQDQLKAEMQTGQPKFALVHRTPGIEERTAYLNFSRKENGEYVLNNYRLSLKNPQFAEPLKQTFFINQGEKNVTLDQATNLLQGRAVHRELKTREGISYQAWQQLDFNQPVNGNFQIRPYGEKYGYDMDKVLQRYSISELNDPTKAAGLKDGLRNGNRVTVTAAIDGKERSVQMEANPRFKTMNFLEMNGIRLKPEQLLKAVQEQSQGKQQTAKQGVTVGSDEPPKQKTGKAKRKGQQVH